jgi:hypothetical protein
MMPATAQIIVFGFQTCGINPPHSNIIQNHLYLSSVKTAKEPVPKQFTSVEAGVARKD